MTDTWEESEKNTFIINQVGEEEEKNCFEINNQMICNNGLASIKIGHVLYIHLVIVDSTDLRMTKFDSTLN